jgi:hypothetical protein
MVDRAAPAGTQTEAFSWLGTASSTGGAAGAAVGGALAQSAGVAAFGLAAGGSVLTAMLGSLGLDNDTAEPHGCLLAEAA